jgi:hypothetical protein
MAQISKFRTVIEVNVSTREAHRCIKIWRALWRIMAASNIAKLVLIRRALCETSSPSGGKPCGSLRRFANSASKRGARATMV